MDYSAANSSLWNIIIQLGLIAGAILAANALRTKVRAIRQAMMPVAVMAGFLLLILKYAGIVHIDAEIMEILVYHGIALGFIAMSLRVPDKTANRKDRAALKSGAIIVSTYMVQAITGLAISMLLGFTRTTSAPATRTSASRAGAASASPSPRRGISAPASSASSCSTFWQSAAASAGRRRRTTTTLRWTSSRPKTNCPFPTPSTACRCSWRWCW